MTKDYPDKIRYFFDHLSADTTELVESFYHPEIHFLDPLVDLQGRKAVSSYYQNIYKPVESISFKFTDFIVENLHVAAFWTMTLQAPKLNKGRPFAVLGMSQIVFEAESSLVIFHRDYYDLGEFIYEKIPFVSMLVKVIKKKLSKH